MQARGDGVFPSLMLKVPRRGARLLKRFVWGPPSRRADHFLGHDLVSGGDVQFSGLHIKKTQDSWLNFWGMRKKKQRYLQKRFLEVPLFLKPQNIIMPLKMEDYPFAIRVPVHCGHLFLTTCKFLGIGIFLSMSNGLRVAG